MDVAPTRQPSPKTATKSDSPANDEPVSAVTIVQAALQEHIGPSESRLVSFQDVQPTPQRPQFEGDKASIARAPIELDAVLVSVENHFPLLIAAAAEREVADGRVVSANGQFDLQFSASSMSLPLGFYQNYRSGVALSQPVYQNGGYVYGGYRLGRGDFPDWYKERQTDGNGEYAVGMGVPLLKDRAIDKRRADLFRAQLDSRSVDPQIQTQLILFSRDATLAYWSWLAAGKSLDVQLNQLRLAKERVQQISLRVEKGDLPSIAKIDNDRFIAARQTKLIEATRAFQSAAITLSLFLRTDDGRPLLATENNLPTDFPIMGESDPQQLDADIAQAISQRPEIAEIDFELQKVQIDRQAAQNLLLPKLDVVVGASKDMGTAASAIDDKSPLELEAGFLAEVPLQRRDAIGKIQTAQAKQSQLTARRAFIVDKIALSVQDTYSGIQNARERFEQASINKALAMQSMDIGQKQFMAGDIDLIVLNIYEQAEADAELVVIDAEVEYYSALANYRAALGFAR